MASDTRTDLIGLQNALLNSATVTEFLHEVAVLSTRIMAGPPEKAFAMLRSVSQNTNTKLRDLATSIVTTASGEPPRPGDP